MSLEPNKQPDKPKPDLSYKPDAYWERSEEFYQKTIIDHICQYCHKDIGDDILCHCEGIDEARELFKERVYAEAGQVYKRKCKTEYNPDKFTEQEDVPL